MANSNYQNNNQNNNQNNENNKKKRVFPWVYRILAALGLIAIILILLFKPCDCKCDCKNTSAAVGTSVTQSISGPIAD